MSGSDLRLEYEAALARTTAVDLGPLRHSGVGEIGLAVGPALAAIRISGDCFELDPDGDAVGFILPVRADNPVSPDSARSRSGGT
jgi:hypothetical protein